MLSDYQTLADKFTRDDAAKITPPDLDRAILLAVYRYSKDRERVKVQDVTPSAANTLPLPAAWEADFSTLKSLEHPIGNVPPTLLESARYELYQDPASIVIKTRDAVAVAANNVRATFTIKHVVTDAIDTIPVTDREPVSCYAAALLCEQLATFYAGQSDSTIQADSVDQKSKSSDFAGRARALRKRYYDDLGVDEDRDIAAGVVVNMNQRDSLGQDRLTHSSRNR